MQSSEIVEYRKQTVAALDKIITIERTPDFHKDTCQVTINLPWDIAEKIAEVAAPFLKNIAGAVDTRTREDMRQEINREESRMRYEARQRQQRLAIYQALRSVHAEGIDYPAFRAAILKNLGQKTPSYCYFGSFSNEELRAMYGRIRLYSVMLRYQRGWPKESIIKFYDITRTNFYNLRQKWTSDRGCSRNTAR